ncbi:MAG: autotransporter adhesin family protein [Kiritimatiellae bacterium]|nr:autotransporter adhesin family protein [Kiritimatiellia bacterium]
MRLLRFFALLAAGIGLTVRAESSWTWRGTEAPNNVTAFTGITLAELKTRIDSKTHYLAGEMAGSAFDGGIAQAADFWADAAEEDGSWTVQLQCVYKNDLRYVNLRLFDDGDGNIKATQVTQNWCSGIYAQQAFEGFVAVPNHPNSSWNPGVAHYHVCSLSIADINDCEASVGGTKYKTLNEAKKVAMAAPAGSPLKEVTLLRDKILWTSAYVENFTLVIPQGVTFTVANDDVANYGDPNAKILVKGTLHVNDGCHVTVGRNALELYAGCTVEGIGDSYGLLYVTTPTAIPVRDNPNSPDKTVTVDGDVMSNVNIAFDIDAGVYLKITGGVNPAGSTHTVTSIGDGTMAVEGSVGGRYTVWPSRDLDVGGITFGADYSVESYGGVIVNTDATNDRNGTKAQMNSLMMTDDTRLTGYSFGLVKRGYAATVVDLGGKTLTIDLRADGNWKTRNFYLANTSIKNGGEIVMAKGDLVLYYTSSEMKNGLLRLKSGAVLNLNGQTFSLNDFVNEGGAIAGTDSGSRMVIGGTLSGSVSLANLTLNDNATIRLKGAETLTVTSSCLVNGRVNVDLSDYLALDQAVLTLPDAATAQAFVTNAELTVPALRTGCSLVASGNEVRLHAVPKTLYWAAWRGTFWEHLGQQDVNGNHGVMRDAAGAIQAHLPNDTVVFDKAHYTVGGDHLATDYWHYDENLYIKNEVRPGTEVAWDLMILEGVTLKLGLCGARATGQNVVPGLKIYVAQGSTLELGYWGNTHHYQGVIRGGAVFGGTGVVTLGADLGDSLRIEGDVANGGEAGSPTLDLKGKELVLCGKAGGARTDVALTLTGFGALSAKNDNVHLTEDVDFGDSATLDAVEHVIACDRHVTFGDRIAVRLAAPPEGDSRIKVLSCRDAVLGEQGTDARVLVNGVPAPAFYELVCEADGVYVQEKRGVPISYSASACLGYDYRTMLANVTMTPPIEGVVVTAELLDADDAIVSTWKAPLDATGHATVLVGDEDAPLAPNADYCARISVGDTIVDTVSCFVGWPAEVGDKLAEVAGVAYASMREAGAASEATGRPIRLLTNVFFAPPPGKYALERNGWLVRMTNDMTLEGNDVLAPARVSHYTNGAADEIERYNFTFEGTWLGWALPWRTRRQIQSALLADNDLGTMTRWQAYVLGFPANEMVGNAVVEQARVVMTCEPSALPGQLCVGDECAVKGARESGVAVLRTLLRQTAEGMFSPVSEATTGSSVMTELDPEVDTAFYRLRYTFHFGQLD